MNKTLTVIKVTAGIAVVATALYIATKKILEPVKTTILDQNFEE